MVEPTYKSKNPKISPLYQSIQSHFGEFESIYEERYQKRYGVLRDVVREVIYKYLGCGDLKKGFARIKCKSCHHEILLAFSCKGRYFCPSCHQKRVLMFGEWITGGILYALPHRQYVFIVPKMLRAHFRFDRKLLGKLSQCAYQSLRDFFRSTLNRERTVPGVVISILPGPYGSIDLHWRTPKRELLINVPADAEGPASYYGDDREEGTGNAIRGKNLDTSADSE